MTEKKVIFLESVDSTNRYVLDLPDEQKSQGLVVRAEEQTAGRGRLGRRWASPRGKGLWLSVLWRQVWPAEKNYLLTFAAALATARAVEEVTLCQTEVKWPNDVLVGRKKVAGILLEQRGSSEPGRWLVAGIGINVSQQQAEFSEAYRQHATSLREACRDAPEKEKLFQALLAQLDFFYDLYRVGKEETLRSFFVESSNIWGERVRIRQANRLLEGSASGIDERGGLLVRTGEKEVAVYAGDLILQEWWAEKEEKALENQ